MTLSVAGASCYLARLLPKWRPPPCLKRKSVLPNMTFLGFRGTCAASLTFVFSRERLRRDHAGVARTTQRTSTMPASLEHIYPGTRMVANLIAGGATFRSRESWWAYAGSIPPCAGRGSVWCTFTIKTACSPSTARWKAQAAT